MRIVRKKPGDLGAAPHQTELQLQTHRSSINPEQRKAEQEPKSSSCVYPADR